MKDKDGNIHESDEANFYGAASLSMTTEDDEYNIKLNLYSIVDDNGNIVANPNYTIGCKSNDFAAEKEMPVDVDWDAPN